MPEMRVLPRLLALFTSGVSAAFSAFIGSRVWRVSMTSDADLLASYRGQAIEDILGFGWWPIWFLVAVVQAVLLAIAFRCYAPLGKRFVVPMLLVAFAVASLLDYSSFQRERSLIFS